MKKRYHASRHARVQKRRWCGWGRHLRALRAETTMSRPQHTAADMTVPESTWLMSSQETWPAVASVVAPRDWAFDTSE